MARKTRPTTATVSVFSFWGKGKPEVLPCYFWPFMGGGPTIPGRPKRRRYLICKKYLLFILTSQPTNYLLFFLLAPRLKKNQYALFVFAVYGIVLFNFFKPTPEFININYAFKTLQPRP